MQLTLNETEASALRNLLHDWLPELRREVARTDLASRELRNELKRRIDVAERVLAQLGEPAGASAPR
jgi:hypothetical protein